MIDLATEDKSSEFKPCSINPKVCSECCSFLILIALQWPPLISKIVFQALTSIEHSVRQQRSMAAGGLTRRVSISKKRPATLVKLTSTGYYG